MGSWKEICVHVTSINLLLHWSCPVHHLICWIALQLELWLWILIQRILCTAGVSQSDIKMKVDHVISSQSKCVSVSMVYVRHRRQQHICSV